MKTEIKNSDLSIIKGDKPVSPMSAGGDFIRAEATDTRLMGVVGLHIERLNGKAVFHQFFYLDFEEYGIEDYQSILTTMERGTDENSESATPESIKQELFGGLGGSWIEVNEREALFLMQSAMAVNIARENPLPENYREFSYLLENPPELDTDSQLALWGKICKPPSNHYELINYFYMRMVGMDEPAAKYLIAPNRTMDFIPMDYPGSLFLNKIEAMEESYDANSTTRSYLVTSVIEDDAIYRTLYSKATVTDTKVVDIEITSDMEISFWEMSIIMRQEEYICHSTINVENRYFDEFIMAEYPTAVRYEHEEGNLYMIFRENNIHVMAPEYRLDHDVVASIFFSRDQEMLIASYARENVYKVLRQISGRFQNFPKPLQLKGKYHFPNATLVSYIDRGFENFEEFLELMTTVEDQ